MGLYHEQSGAIYRRMRRLEIELLRIASFYGLDGSPWAEVRPETATGRQHGLASAIYLDLPGDLRKLPDVTQMCYAIVASSTNPIDQAIGENPRPARKNYGRRR